MIDKCPDFYESLTQSMMVKLPPVAHGYFAGIDNKLLSNLFLPNQTGFIYYNNALEDLPVIFNSGATISITPDINDFITYEPCSKLGVKSITGQSQVQESGLVRWMLYDDHGHLHTITATAYYISTARV